MNEIEDGIYLHKVFNIVYLVRGESVMIRPDDDPYWELSDMIGGICKHCLIMA